MDPNLDFKFTFPQNRSLTSYFRPVALEKLDPALGSKAISGIWKYKGGDNLIE